MKRRRIQEGLAARYSRRKPETDCDSGFDFYWLTVEPIRLIPPLPNGLCGSFDQDRKSPDKVDFFYRAVFAHDDSQYDVALNAFFLWPRVDTQAESCGGYAHFELPRKQRCD